MNGTPRTLEELRDDLLERVSGAQEDRAHDTDIALQIEAIEAAMRELDCLKTFRSALAKAKL